MFCVAVKVVLVAVMKAYRWNRGIPPFILNLGNRWRWWSTPRHGHLIRGEVTAVLIQWQWKWQGSSVKLKVLENKQICTCRESKYGSAIPQRRKEKWKTVCAKAIGQILCDVIYTGPTCLHNVTPAADTENVHVPNVCMLGASQNWYFV